jgi:hypothetical protein
MHNALGFKPQNYFKREKYSVLSLQHLGDVGNCAEEEEDTERLKSNKSASCTETVSHRQLLLYMFMLRYLIWL